MGDRLLLDLYRNADLPARPVSAGPLDAAGFSSEALARFALWNGSTWALDLIAQRLQPATRSWAELRAAVVAADASGVWEEELGSITRDDLFVLWDAIGSGRDTEAESAITGRLAEMMVDSKDVDADKLARLVAGLLRLDRDGEARALLPLMTPGSWPRLVSEIELSHPRFGGTLDDLLSRLNGVYEGVGLASVSLEEEGGSPFLRLGGGSGGSERGPLVTVIMSAWRPGNEILTAVRSIIAQTYLDWELVVTDDASGSEYDDIFATVEALDPRVRVIRNATNRGTYSRRNEVLRDASGAFVTFQDSDDWSHPARLAVQVQDLLDHPDRIGNVVRHARVTEDLSFATNRGMALTLAEPSIMFRRARAMGIVGFYDSVRKGADREYRLRLEAMTGSIVATVGPEAPLQLMLADASSLSGGDFAPGWMTPARVAYRNATDRYHLLAKSGRASGRIEYPQPRRSIVAPVAFLGPEDTTAVEVDILVVVDGRERKGRGAFLGQVIREIQAALDAGVSIGLLHSDSVGGRAGGPRLSMELQAMVDDHLVSQVLNDDVVNADLVVIRHASAAQGHTASRRPISASRVVVVEDLAGGDEQGRSISLEQVVSTVAAWTGLAPRSVSAAALEGISIDTRDVAERRIVLVSTSGAPSARLKYADQVVAFDAGSTVIRFQPGRGRIEGADVVHGVGRMEQTLALTARSTPRERLERTRRFVRDLTNSGTALVRTVFGPAVSSSHPSVEEAAKLLDAATTTFVAVDRATVTPDPSRTVLIPFGEPTSLIAGYPLKEPISGRLLIVAQESPSTLAPGALRSFFVTRTPALSLRIAGMATEALLDDFGREGNRLPESATFRPGRLSDAALLEELSAAELVLAPGLHSLDDYPLIMMALAVGRPVLAPASDALVALEAEVGSDWIIPIESPVSAARLDEAIERARKAPLGSKPRLAGRDWWDVGRRYEQVLRAAADEARRLAHANPHNSADAIDAPGAGGLDHAQ